MRGMEFDGSTPVVQLSLGDDRLGHGPLALARSLGRLGVEFHAVQPAHVGPLARSRYLRGATRLPIPLTSRQVVEALVDVAELGERRPVLIPTDDLSCLVVADHADVLRDWYRFPEQPPGLARKLADKEHMHELARQLGLPTARTSFPKSPENLAGFLEDARFPVVVKSIRGYNAAKRSGPRMAIVSDPAQLRAAYDAFQEPHEPNVLFQEYIPGGPEAVWMFNGYFDREGHCRFGLTGRKLRQHPAYSGMCSLGILEANPTVEELTERLASETGYRGIIDVDLCFDRRDGRYKLVDVNPRIGSSFRLFAADGGMDVARALYLDLTGQPVPSEAPAAGRRWLVETHDPVSCLRYWRDGRLTLGRWAGSLRGIRELAWFSRDDPAPFLSVCARLPRLAVRMLLRRLRTALQRRR